MISSWPVWNEAWSFPEDEAAVETIKEAVKGIRTVRTDLNVPPSRKTTVVVVSEEEGTRAIFENSKVFFATLAHAGEVQVQSDKAGIGEDAVSAVVPSATIYMPLAELVDLEKERERLKKEQERLAGELKRVNGMLANERFLSKAPESKIQEEQEKRAKYTAMMEQVTERLKAMGE